MVLQEVGVKYFEDFALGEIEKLGEHRLTEEEIIEYAKNWDPVYFHTDPDAAMDSILMVSPQQEPIL